MYAIKHRFTTTNKKGISLTMECYFVSQSKGMINMMAAGIEGAKQFSSKVKANQERRRCFGISKKYSVIKIEQQ